MEEFALHFEETGSGLPVLLIHGFPFTSRMWRPQLDNLGSQARILAPDLPGFGDSPASELPTTVPHGVGEFAEDCLTVLDALDILEPAVIGGFSMGGYIALAFAKLFPERVRALMLFSTRAGADSAEGKAGRDKSIATAREKGAEAIADGMFPKFLAPANYAAKPDVASELKEIMSGATREGVIAGLTAMRDRPDSTSFLSTIDVPTLIIHGREDQLIPYSEAELMAKAIPQSELHLLANAGHAANLEQSKEFNGIVSKFLSKVRK